VQEALLRYHVDGARTKLDVDAGYATLERDLGPDDDGPLLRLNLARALTAHSVLSLDAGQEFANSAEAFQAHTSGGSVSLDSYGGRQTAAPFTRRHAILGWDATGARTHLSLAANWEEQDYGGASQFNETLTAFRVRSVVT
jgi:hypothetical protein